MKVEDVFRIGKLFDELKWPTQDIKGPFPRLFDRFCRMCSRLTPEQRKLIIDITPAYNWIRTEQNGELLLHAWEQLLNELSPNIHTIAFVPLLKPKDKQPKSSSAIWYLAKGNQSSFREDLENNDNYKHIKLIFCQDVEEFGAMHASSGVMLVLLDDYVGTGNSAKRCIKDLRARFSIISDSEIMVLTLVTQKTAVDKLNKLGYKIIASRVLERGISDNLNLLNRSEALELMKMISVELQFNKVYWHGYKKSEALVTMTITPNNTFPVFWTNKKIGDTVWDSPFTRYTNDGS